MSNTNAGKTAELSKEEFCADIARAHANEAMTFFSPTQEGYKLRAKNSYQRGFIDGCDYTNQSVSTAKDIEIQRLRAALEEIKYEWERNDHKDTEESYNDMGQIATTALKPTE